eukprot:CAMPEP_0118942828 /NCGR_PEP_ID=MMETSP1169-20130426/36939_1 /TAXON_ID=36882 /ORGANISM="Pyramimonas obovata, Strain CCMP722" /LENGTH=236 /DNA_ID=CAMNT_0006887915 /DNA_START=288 /DNA_END=995 /DNA_ORIENTATION=+
MGDREPSEEEAKLRAEEQAKRVSLLISEWDLLKFYDGSNNIAAFIWREMAEIPREHMHILLKYLNSDCIYKLWAIGNLRYKLKSKEFDAITNFGFDPMGELRGKALGYPREVIFDGRAAGLPFSVLNRFSKVFVTVPDTGEVFGRTLLGKGSLVDGLVPLYFKVGGGEVVPPFDEPADLCLKFGGLEVIPPEVPVSDEDNSIILPPSALSEEAGADPSVAWPAPTAPVYPFSGNID